jgi:hypothetical protein
VVDTEVTLPPCEDMLSEERRRIWCADVDPTGRYVCRRRRPHELDWHAGRNAAGGIHQWPVRNAEPAESPAEDPHGTVRVHPDDDHMSPTARRRIAVDASDYCGPYEGCRWQRLTGVGIGDGGCDPLHSRDVAGWPVQPLAELAVVLGHTDREPPKPRTIANTPPSPVSQYAAGAGQLGVFQRAADPGYTAGVSAGFAAGYRRPQEGR